MKPVFFNSSNPFFSGSEASDSSTPSTPEKSTPERRGGKRDREAPSSPATPIRAALGVLQASTPGRPANPRELAVFSRLERSLERNPAPVKRLLTTLEETLPKIDGTLTHPDDPRGSLLVSVENLDEQVTHSWMEQFFKILRNLGVAIHVVNTGHLTKPQVIRQLTTGFHFCPEGDLNASLIRTSHRNPVTEVWFGVYNAGKKDKASSFFPRSIATEDDLLRVISDGEKIAQNANRALFVSQTEPPFHFEVYYKEAGLYITSAFPIFEFQEYRADGVIFLPLIRPIEMRAILAKLRTFDEYDIKTYHRFTFTENGEAFHVMDVASLLEGCPIIHGVYIKIPASELHVMVDGVDVV